MRRRRRRPKKEIVIKVVKNEEIRAEKVRVVDDEGEMRGVLPLEQAIALANEEGVDLILIAENAKPPVCKLILFDKYRYQISKKKQKAKSKQKKTTLKEVRLSVKISDNDYNVKQNNARRFLEAGDKVKFTLRFVGREITHSNLGREIVERMVKDLEEISEVEQEPKFEKRSIGVILAPKKK